ncbi:MAG TPA: type II toxin-antitoxin system HicA family toxin [Chloroflexota bacterium]|nr:type II toxin-antitoxin system HicA family toxin [Chloroflexota bacterium]
MSPPRIWTASWTRTRGRCTPCSLMLLRGGPSCGWPGWTSRAIHQPGSQRAGDRGVPPCPAWRPPVVAGRLPRITAADLLRALERAGWTRTRQRGSHVRLRHADRPGGVTVSVHPGAIVKPGTLLGVLEQAGLTVEDLVKLL